jgi:hypothetical protein
LAVDTLGSVLCVVVHSASIQDQDGEKLLLAKLKTGVRHPPAPDSLDVETPRDENFI